MKTLLLTGTLLVSSFMLSINAQTEESPNSSGQHTFTKRIEAGNTASKQSGTPSVSKEKSDNLANPADRTNNNSDGTSHLSTPVPATKTTSNVVISEIKYSLDNKNSTLTNLLNLIEIKEKVNESNNSSLLNSSEYDQLLSDIETLRSKFDQYVESKGINQCSTTEQSYYLAFLKEEGKEDEYNEAIQELK
jgi:hypothetical protein